MQINLAVASLGFHSSLVLQWRSLQHCLIRVTRSTGCMCTRMYAQHIFSTANFSRTSNINSYLLFAQLSYFNGLEYAS
jgi:hypothetical protein